MQSAATCVFCYLIDAHYYSQPPADLKYDLLLKTYKVWGNINAQTKKRTLMSENLRFCTVLCFASVSSLQQMCYTNVQIQQCFIGILFTF